MSIPYHVNKSSVLSEKVLSHPKKENDMFLLNTTRWY